MIEGTMSKAEDGSHRSQSRGLHWSPGDALERLKTLRPEIEDLKSALRQQLAERERLDTHTSLCSYTPNSRLNLFRLLCGRIGPRPFRTVLLPGSPTSTINL